MKTEKTTLFCRLGPGPMRPGARNSPVFNVRGELQFYTGRVELSSLQETSHPRSKRQFGRKDLVLGVFLEDASDGEAESFIRLDRADALALADALRAYFEEDGT